MRKDLVSRFRAALPGVRRWIDELVRRHEKRRHPLSELGFEELSRCFDARLLARVGVVEVAEVPFPPLDQLGIPELAVPEPAELAGITFTDTIFIRRGEATEGLLFHELVHVVQWARLGEDDFLLAYGLGLSLHGYRDSPLEEMAYSLQWEFEAGREPSNLAALIERRTDRIWAELAGER